MVSASIAGRSPDAFELPASTWGRSQRPFSGTLVRWCVAGVFVVAAPLLPSWPLALGAIALGLAVFFLFPWWVARHLEGLGRHLAAVTPAGVPSELRHLEDKRLVAMFAPYAWVQIQRARLLAKVADGRGAAAALGEAARMCGGTPATLLGLQADALLLGSDRRGALQILRRLETDARLSDRDRVNLGVVLLDERGGLEQAITHLQQAAPNAEHVARREAAIAVALAKKRRFSEAREALTRATAASPEPPEAVVAELLKRANKGLRDAPQPAAAKEDAKDPRKERRRKRKARRDRAEVAAKGGHAAAKGRETSAKGSGAAAKGREGPAKGSGAAAKGRELRRKSKQARRDRQDRQARPVGHDGVPVTDERPNATSTVIEDHAVAEVLATEALAPGRTAESIAVGAEGSTSSAVEAARVEDASAVSEADATGERMAEDAAPASKADPADIGQGVAVGPGEIPADDPLGGSREVAAEKWQPPKVQAQSPVRPIDDDPWAELVAGDDEEIRPA